MEGILTNEKLLASPLTSSWKDRNFVLFTLVGNFCVDANHSFTSRISA